MAGPEEEWGELNEPFLQLAGAVVLSRCRDVVSGTKAEARIDLRDS